MSTPEALISVSADQLIKGMYVVLPRGWFEHPFLRNQFIISSDKEIKQLKQCAFPQYQVDIEKSKLPPGWNLSAPDVDKVDYTGHGDPTMDSKTTGIVHEQWNATNLIPEQLKAAVYSPTMPPVERSEAVYRYSVEMMRRLLQSPSAENIKESKKAIGSIADLILSDDQTAGNLLRITSHDFYTYTHSVNVGVTSIMLAKALFKGSNAHNIRELGAGFFLHDIGKVKIRPEVINKEGPLSDSEMKHMRIHPYQGYKLLKEAGELTEECRYIIMQHHERDDGLGYPKGLTGDEIHTYGKICCLADVFDALTADRSYKKALAPFEALRLMKEQMTGHFDKKIFATFVKLYQ